MYCLFQDTFLLQSCIVTSPVSNTIRVSCEFLGASRRVSINATCTSCEGAQAVVTAVGNSPLDIPDLLSEDYTAEVIAVDASNKRLGNNEVTQTITVNTGTYSDSNLQYILSYSYPMPQLLLILLQSL